MVDVARRISTSNIFFSQMLQVVLLIDLTSTPKADYCLHFSHSSTQVNLQSEHHSNKEKNCVQTKCKDEALELKRTQTYSEHLWTDERTNERIILLQDSTDIPATENEQSNMYIQIHICVRCTYKVKRTQEADCKFESIPIRTP